MKQKLGRPSAKITICGVEFESARQAAAELDVSEVYVRGALAVLKALREYRIKQEDMC